MNIRNFTIISHIDHGKSTLADRFLEVTETIPKNKLEEQYLDRMSLEKERGITIKMHPCRIIYNNCGKEYQLNLIDTPGHVDFCYEVSRALAAVEGAVLLVDATKGIQAQTIANLEMAQKENLVIIPVINKIDMPNAQIDKATQELAILLGIEKEKVIKISAKRGTNIKEVLDRIIKEIPSPKLSDSEDLSALIFDSKYDSFQGVTAFVRVFGGRVKKGDKIFLLKKAISLEVREVGYFIPDFQPKEILSTGEIGYIKTGIKEPEKLRVGDTITSRSEDDRINIKPLPGYKEPSPVIFSSIFPQEPSTIEDLKKSIQELHLSDPSFTFKEERKKILGIGFCCGFLGLLHLQIVLERLKREFAISLISATPIVSYKIIDKERKEHLISSSEDWLDPSAIEEIKEPWTSVEILTPQEYFNEIFQLFTFFSVNFISSENFGEDKIRMSCQMPFRKLIENFYDKLKNVSKGFASMNFEIQDYRSADLVKLDFLVAGEVEPSLSRIADRKEAENQGRKIVEALKEVFPPQLFAVPLQASVGAKIIARETVKARRKDVTAPLYGGDVTRKKKLLEKQKKGKKKLAKGSKLRIPNEVIIELLKK